MALNRSAHCAPALLLVLACWGACIGGACSEPTDTTSPAAQRGERPGGLAFVDPEFPAEPDMYEFGHAELGERLQKTVRMRNDDGRPLLIQSIRPGCSCTQPRISYVDVAGKRVQGNTLSDRSVLTLPPGAVAELELVIDTTIAPVFNRHKTVIVRITTDSPTNPYTTVQLRMMILRAFSAAPPEIDLQQIAIHGLASGKSDLVALGDTGARLVDVLDAPEGVDARLTLKNVFGAEVWELHATLAPPHRLGLIEHTIRLRTTGPKGEGEGRPFEIKLRAVGVHDVQIEPALVLLQARGEEPASAAAQLVARLAGQRVHVLGARVEGAFAEQLEVHATPVAPDGEGRAAVWDLNVTASAPLPREAFSGELVLTLDDPQYPLVKARLIHRPRPQSP